MKIVIRRSLEQPLNTKRPKVGLALSGGGLRGAAHIGVLRVLIEENVPIDYVAGTSAGSIVAAMYGAGLDPDAMEHIVSHLTTRELVDFNVKFIWILVEKILKILRQRFDIWSVVPLGLMKGLQIEKLLKKCLQNRMLCQTRLPIAIPAVDINSGETVLFLSHSELRNPNILTNTVYNDRAFLHEAVRASISLPGVFIPKTVQGRNLVDGGIKGNLPCDIVHCMGADIIIAVDMGNDGQPVASLRHMGEVIIRTVDILGRELTVCKTAKYANIVLMPKTPIMGLTDFSLISECIRCGERTARAHIREIKQLLAI